MTLETYGEPVARAFDHVFRGRRLHRERSPFQTIEVFEHDHFGRMLLLDGLVQTTERDEFCYHEMLVHPALLARERIERALVIGGGEGGALRRALQHADAAVVCEIDPAVTDVSRRFLPSVSDGALDDPRATVVFEDGALFLADHPGQFDAIIVDSTDPVGPAVVLFSQVFYESCLLALRPGGVLVAQSGSPMYQLEEMQTVVRNMSSVLPTVEVYTGFVPTYPGVLWSFTVGTTGAAVSSASPQDLARRSRERGLRTRFYTPELHRAAFALPAFVDDAVEEARASSAQPASVPGR